MWKIIAAIQALIQSYNKDLDPLERLVLRERFPPWPVFALISWGVFLIMIIVFLFQLAGTIPH